MALSRASILRLEDVIAHDADRHPLPLLGANHTLPCDVRTTESPMFKRVKLYAGATEKVQKLPVDIRRVLYHNFRL